MLSLPTKPWKKVKIDNLRQGEFLLTFLSEFESKAQFDEVIKEDIVASLGSQDQIGERNWALRNVAVTTPDLEAFKRRLVYACIMIENDD